MITKIQHALECHQKGQYTQAKTLYQELISQNPQNDEAQHLLGVLYYQKNQLEEAQHHLELALKLAPNTAHYHSNYANVLKDLNHPKEAIQHYKIALKGQAKMAETENNLGTCYHDLKKYKMAVKHYQSALKIKPEYIEARFNFGRMLQEQGFLERALKQHLKIIAQNPSYADSHFEMGMIYQKQNNHSLALDSYQKAHSLKPQDPISLNNAAFILEKLGEPEQALQLYRRALEINPHYLTAAYNMGTLFEAYNQTPQAIATYQNILSLDPQFFMAHYNLACLFSSQNKHQISKQHFEACLKQEPGHIESLIALGNISDIEGQSEQAKSHYEHVLQLHPKHTGAYYNLGIMARENQEYTKAQTIFEDIIKTHPTFTEASFALGSLELLLGNSEKGWPLYESRPDIPKINRPLWQGQDLNQKNILIISEQGFGDIIQFSRYLPLLKALGAKVSFIVSSLLEPLFESMSGIDQLLTETPDFESFDYYSPLLSLPQQFQTTQKNIPAPSQFGIKKRISPLLESPKVKAGLVWATGKKEDPTAYQMYLKKSIPFEKFAPFSEHDQTEVFSLQIGPDQVSKEHLDTYEITDLAPEIKDFKDSAEWIQALDLVITTDTAVAHLAGSLNKPTYLLLHTPSDWRWGLSESHSPWYPSIRIYRKNEKSWDKIISQLFHDLSEIKA